MRTFLSMKVKPIFLLFFIIFFCAIKETSEEVKYIHPSVFNINQSPHLAKNLLSKHFLLNNLQVCKLPHIENVIVVISHPSNHKKRIAIRHTWGAWATKKGFQVIFFVGRATTTYANKIIKYEFSHYHDLIQLDVAESYQNLTLKTLSVLYWLKNFCVQVQFIAKIDDDTFVHVNNFQKILLNIVSHVPAVYGQSCSTTKPSRDPESHYYIPKEYYPSDKYPIFICGRFYFFPGRMLSKLYDVAYQEPLTVMEDVFLTGLVAPKANLRLGLISRFVYWEYFHDHKELVDLTHLLGVLEVPPDAQKIMMLKLAMATYKKKHNKHDYAD